MALFRAAYKVSLVAGIAHAGSEIHASGPTTKFIMDEGEATEAILTADKLNGLLRTKRPLTVHGTSDTFYPVWFSDSCWSDMSTTISIDRDSVHMDVNWKGSMHLDFTFHSHNNGHGSSFWKWEYVSYQKQHWADWMMHGAKRGVGLWLMGGSTYTFRSTCATTTIEQAPVESPDAPIVYNYQGDPTASYSFSIAPTQEKNARIKIGHDSSILAVQDLSYETLKVHGTFDKYYPVWFSDPCWSQLVTNLKIMRDSVHMDINWRGSMLLDVNYHSHNNGHGSGYWNYFYVYYQSQLFGDLIVNGKKTGVGLWLKGDSTYKVAWGNCGKQGTIAQAPVEDPDKVILDNDGATLMAPITAPNPDIKKGSRSSLDIDTGLVARLVALENLANGKVPGQILQTVTRSFLVTSNSAHSNTTPLTTPQHIVDAFKTSIQPKATNSRILVRYSIDIAGERAGPSNAFTAIGFKSSATSQPALTTAEYAQASGAVNCYRNELGHGDAVVMDNRVVGNNFMFSEVSHAHKVPEGDWAVYTALAWTTYTNAGGGYIFSQQAGVPGGLTFSMTLQEISI